MIDLKNKKILVTGGAGFLGSFVVQRLLARGVPKGQITVPLSKNDDLRKVDVCRRVVAGHEIVIHVAASVGGLRFVKDHPAEAFYDSAAMAINMIDESYRAGVEKFVGIGSVCEYPKFVPLPFKEENLWDGYPEPDNAAYGLAKKMMLVQSQAYREQYGFNAIHLLMVNLYGPRDNFDLMRSHVIPALIRKVYEAKKNKTGFIEIWGTGIASREFLYADDAAEGILLATEKYDKSEPVNIGRNDELLIKDLIQIMCRLMDYNPEIRWDATRPDGQPKRRFDVSKAEKEFGFKAQTGFEEGLKKTIDWYINTQK